jgi:hypothetical protein
VWIFDIVEVIVSSTFGGSRWLSRYKGVEVEFFTFSMGKLIELALELILGLPEARAYSSNSA